jgi:glycosyltransferase involved in cell wall biosynthesis
MGVPTGLTDAPLVSMILTTRDRPDFLPIALRCFAEQDRSSRELIVVDDGERFPADQAAIEAVGGRLIRVKSGTPLGEKLNTGCELANGLFLTKMDDDDWYGAHFLELLTSRISMEWENVCSPAISFIQPIHFFSLARWEIRRSNATEAAGGSLCFPRSVWRATPFRHIVSQVDFWFLFDCRRSGTRTLSVSDNRAFLNVRHGGVNDQQPHIWQHQHDNRPVDEHVARLPLAGIEPEAVLPAWAIERYRAMHDVLVT